MAEGALRVVVASTLTEMETFRPFWTRHNRHPESAPDFVSLLVQARPEIVRPHVVVACEGARPVALMVGRLEKASLTARIGYREWLRLPLLQLVFVRDGYLGEASARASGALLQHLQGSLRSGVADRALLSSVPVDAALHHGLLTRFGALQRDGASRHAEHWLAHLPPDLDAFLAKRSAKHRYGFRRMTRLFEADHDGKVRYATFEHPQEVPPFCQAAEAVARVTYQRGLGAGFFDNEENRLRLLLSARVGMLQAHVLYVAETPVAFWAGERIGDVMHIIWTAFDPAYRKHEVGTILFLKMVERLLARGVKIIDFGPGGAQYKERFGDLCLTEQDVAVYALTAKGLAARSLCGLHHVADNAGRRLLDRLGVTERLKKSWRAALAKQLRAAPANAPGAHVDQREMAVPTENTPTRTTFAWRTSLARAPLLRAGVNAARSIESAVGDWCMNVNTGKPVHFGAARGLNQDACDFETNAHSTIVKAIRTVRLLPSDIVFVIGCGRGRALCHFARQRVRKVVGIELDPQLCDDARRNAHALRRRRAPVEIRQADAAVEDVSDGTVFFMFNPFGELTVRAFMRNIESAQQRSTKRLVVVYANPQYAHVLRESAALLPSHEYRGWGGLHVVVFRNRAAVDESELHRAVRAAPR